MAKFKVGDKLIYGEGEWYEAGTVVTVLEVDSDDEEMPYLVSDGEYDYWVEAYSVSGKPTKNQRISTLEQQVETLTRRIEALEQGTSYTHTPRPSVEVVKPLTPNQQRKAIIDEAKAFVESVQRKQRDRSYTTEGNEILRGFTTKTEFVVNDKKRTVVALIRYLHGVNLPVIAKGIAKCAPDDVFNEHIGKAIALGRALGLDVTRFEQAVQPEPAVGQRIKVASSSGNIMGVDIPDNVEIVNGKFRLSRKGEGLTGGGAYTQYRPENGAQILDDTEAQY